MLMYTYTWQRRKDSRTNSSVQVKRKRESVYGSGDWESKLIGFGSYGEVFLHQKGEESVAIKQYAKKDVGSEEEFYTELAALTKAKRHPSLVGFIEAFESQDAFNIVLEFCALGDLNHVFVERFPLEYTEKDVRDLVMQSASGLLHLQKNDLVHRDIKPANIFVRSWNPINVALGDFNYAQDSGMRTLRTNLGTQDYKAPEISNTLLRRQGRSYDFKVDVFSLGMIAYELLGAFNIPDLKLPQNLFNDLSFLSRGQLRSAVWFEIEKKKRIKQFFTTLSERGIPLVPEEQWKKRVSVEAAEVVGKMVLPVPSFRCDYFFILQSKWKEKDLDNVDPLNPDFSLIPLEVASFSSSTEC